MSRTFLLAILLLCGCGDDPRLGSAQHAAIEAGAHAKETRSAAETAAVDAAAKDALAAELAALAELMPTAERIAAAADARVAAASARAVRDALAKVADAADGRAKEATRSAEVEHQREAKASADAGWLHWCRLIALGCTVAGAVLGFLVGYLTKEPRTGIILGGGLIGIGMLVLAFGVALPWLAWLVPAGLVVALGWWAMKHRQLDRKADGLGAAVVDAVAFGNGMFLANNDTEANAVIEQAKARQAANGTRDHIIEAGAAATLA